MSVALTVMRASNGGTTMACILDMTFPDLVEVWEEVRRFDG